MITSFGGVRAVSGDDFCRYSICACGLLLGGVLCVVRAVDGNFRRDGRMFARGRRRLDDLGDALVFLRGRAGFAHLCRAASLVVVLVAIGLILGVGAVVCVGILVRRPIRRSEEFAAGTAFAARLAVSGPPPAKLEGQSLYRHGLFICVVYLLGLNNGMRGLCSFCMRLEFHAAPFSRVLCGALLCAVRCCVLA